MNKRSTPADFAGKQRTAPDAGHRARKGSAEYPRFELQESGRSAALCTGCGRGQRQLHPAGRRCLIRERVCASGSSRRCSARKVRRRRPRAVFPERAGIGSPP
ncbi:hypothetical protein SAMN02910435_01734 [Ruminococcaceae bacterium D5]|nr:hypothetical protein SAMN02910435_01734 [Ruminococcaceae bacterium D5]